MNVAETLARHLDVAAEEEGEEEAMDVVAEEEAMVVVVEGAAMAQILTTEVGGIDLAEGAADIVTIIDTMEADPEGVAATAAITTTMVEDVTVVTTAMHKEEIVTTNGKNFP